MVDGFALVGAAGALEAGAGGKVELAADEGLDALVFGLIVELYGAVEVTVVSQGQGLHAEGGGAVHEPVDPAGPVEQGVIGMDVKMNEIGVGRGQGPRMGVSGLGSRKN